MQGWNIFTHSARMIFGNLNAALRVSLVLYLVKFGAGIYVASQHAAIISGPHGDGTMPNFGPESLSSGIILMLVTLVTSLWIAVSWHRYVLLEETPGAALPPFKGDRILAYFWSSLLLGLVILLAALVPIVISSVIVAGLFGVNSPILSLVVIVILVGIPTMYVFYRYCLILPAAALGEPKKMVESWVDTKPASGAIWQLIVIGLIATMLVEVPALINGDPTSIVNMAYSFVMGWIVMMVGISVMTTLYGIYVEGREL